MGNSVKTAVLLSVLTAILVAFGALFGERGALIALAIALAMNWFSYFFSDKIVLAMYRAREVSPADAPELHRMVERLAQIAGVPKPRLWVVPSETPNAFATGRDPAHASVAVTSGIMDVLNEQELAGVLAHEISHVKNRDILIQTVAATIAGAITFLANMVRWAAMFGGGRDDDRNGNFIGLAGMLLLAVLAPIAAMIVQLAISRSREYMADESGARISGNPIFLADALRKLAAGVRARPMAAASPTTAPLFIVNPFSGRSLAALFSTHPPMEERIRRLEEMRIG